MKQITPLQGRLILLILLITFSSSHVWSQEVRPVSSIYAIENARIVQSPGRVIESGTVILEKGVITSVGQGITIPAGAIRIKADSMTVYAGFIDGFSHAGIPKPKEDANQNRTKEKDPGNPSYERAGITPYVTVRESINPSDASISSLRSAGFTLVQSAPYGRMLPGQTGLVLLSGNQNMVMKDQTGLYAQLEGANGVYPNTIIGVMAKFRELYRQAELVQNDLTRYNLNPSNMVRPLDDEVLEAFYPVVNGGKPMVFSAPDINSLQRVISLQKEMGFPLSIVDIKQGWDMTAALKASTFPVYLSLDLPEWKEEVTDSTNTVDDAKEALIKRQVEFISKQYTLPAAWSAAGITYGFSTNDAKTKDIHKHLIKMKEAGVSEDVLLAGLTTNPAKLMGIASIVGTVEPGKMANVIVSSKGYFEEDAQIIYVFVEGELFEYEIKKPDSKGGEGDSPIGSWTYVVATPDGDGTGSITLREDGNNVRGTLVDTQSGFEYDLKNVKLEDNILSFDFMYSDGANEIPIIVTVTISGNTFSGSADAGSVGSFPMTGEKLPKSN